MLDDLGDVPMVPGACEEFYGDLVETLDGARQAAATARIVSLPVASRD